MQTAARDLVITTAQGALRGALVDGIASFKGVPYAAPPFGRNRFMAPQPAPHWDGVRDALAAGPVPPQAPYPPAIFALLGDQGVVGEDCLNLNIWTAEPAPGAKLPVMVWIPGGAFARGGGSLPVYDGSHLARDGVVCVTINYRLGADGFLQLDNAVPNRGLLDQVAALQWVQANIAAFGGDPSNVTIFGESAGAFSIGALLAMPVASGLFRRAILQSGAGHHSISTQTAELVCNNLVQTLGVEPTIEALAGVPLQRLIAESTTLAAEMAMKPDPVRWGEAALNGMMFEPVVDGQILPHRPIDRIRDGVTAGIDIMIGTTSEEWRFFVVPTGLLDLISEDQLRLFTAFYGVQPDEVLPRYRSARPEASPGDVYCAVVTDWFFRVPAVRLAEAHASNGGTPFVYEFGWRSPLFQGKLGACHALELGFVFDNLDAARPMTGEAAPESLARSMHRSWVAFVTDGNPGWPSYSPERRTVMRFAAETETVIDPRADERSLWERSR